MESVQIQGKKIGFPLLSKSKPSLSPAAASLSKYWTGHGPGRLWTSTI